MRHSGAGRAEVSPVEHWDMSGLAPRDVDDQLHALGGSAPVLVDMGTERAHAPARFALMQRAFGSARMSDTALDNFFCVRTARHVRDDSVPQLTLSVPTPGVRFEQHGNQVVSGARSIVSYWSTSPYSQRIVGPTRTRTVTVPVSDLGLPHRLLRAVVARDVGASPLGGLVFHHLISLTELPEVDVDAADSLGRPVVDLLRAMFALAAGDEEGARGPLNHTLGSRIMIHLRAHVHDPAISADAVAARFGISKRYL